MRTSLDRALLLIPLLVSSVLLTGAVAAAPTNDEPILKTIELEWEEVAGAGGYIVKLTPEKAGAESLYFTAREPHLTQQVPVGTYKLRIRAQAAEDDRLSPWSAPLKLEVLVKELTPLTPADGAVLESKHRRDDVVEFSWTPVAGVKDYTITIWTASEPGKLLKFITRAAKKRLTVKTGHEYLWRVNFESATDITYAQTPPTFHFTLMGPKLITPTGFKLSGAGPDRALSWSSPDGAESYKATLSFRFLDEKEYRPLRTEPALPRSSWNPGELRPGSYQLRVTAQAPKRIQSEPGIYEFTVKPTQAQLAAALAGDHSGLSTQE
jgi:hypothetical protein